MALALLCIYALVLRFKIMTLLQRFRLHSMLHLGI